MVEGIKDENEGLTMLLRCVEKYPGLRIPGFAKIIDIPSKTVERWTVQLKKLNLIEYRGSKKTGGFYIIRKIN